MELDRRARAHSSLLGLAVGDALGSQFFVPANRQALAERRQPPGPWSWTDDTEMACSIYTALDRHGMIDQDALVTSFATHHDFDRGYGPATNRLLRLVREGGTWRELAADLFDGHGSWGNGAAMRVAPLGAWFAGDPARAADQAGLSAQVTHTHPEGVAGAIAVAVATALAATGHTHDPSAFLDAILEHVPASQVRDGIRTVRDELLAAADPRDVAAVVGNGRQVSAQDTVPFTLWVAATHPDSYVGAFWATASAGGDIDTTCAIVGGILASRPLPDCRPPTAWLEQCEPLPNWVR